MSDLDSLKEEIKSRIDIVDFISRYISVKKVGQNYMAYCPFHDDKKSPSFSIVRDKGFYHCFGCGKSGDIFTFLMEYESLTFGEALKKLAEEAGIELKENTKTSLTKSLRDVMNLVAQYYKENLVKSNEALEYLKQRDIKLEWALDYGMGYALDNWEGVINFLKSNNIDLQFGVDLGLLSSTNSKLYDKFRKRIMLPFYDTAGYVVGFTGRVIDNSEPKYMNTPETKIFQKSKLIFGYNKSIEFIRNSKEVIIVEGNLDFISLFYRGIKNVVAISGTSFSNYQAKKLAMLADSAIIMLDGDSAGLKGIRRLIPFLLNEEIEIKVLVLPKDEDPDSLVRKLGKDEFMSFVNKNVLSLIDFLSLYYKKKFGDMTELSVKKKIVNDLKEIVNLISSPVSRLLFIDLISQNLKINSKVFEDSPNNYYKQNIQNSANIKNEKTSAIKYLFLTDILYFLVNFPQFISSFRDSVNISFSGKEWLFYFEKLFELEEKEHLENIKEKFIDFLLGIEENIYSKGIVNIKNRILEKLQKTPKYIDELNKIEEQIKEIQNSNDMLKNILLGNLKKQKDSINKKIVDEYKKLVKFVQNIN